MKNNINDILEELVDNMTNEQILLYGLVPIMGVRRLFPHANYLVTYKWKVTLPELIDISKEYIVVGLN